MKLALLSTAFLLIAGSATLFADDLDDALNSLKQAEPSKDAAKIKKLSAEAHAVAKKYQGTAPADADRESFEARARYAKDVDTYSEYALYALAIQDPKDAADLMTTLEQQNPKSKYLEMPDALMALADNALGRKQQDRAVTYANRIIASQKAPEGMAAADWERAKNGTLGRAYFIVGSVACDRNQYLNADKNLRAALPLIKGNNGMLQPALFCLGVANYNLSNMTANKAKMVEAAKFSEQAAAIQGPLQDQAYKNASAMKAAADKMR